MLYPMIISLITSVASLVIEYSTLTRRRSIFTHLALRLLAPVVIFGSSFLLSQWGIQGPLVYYALGSLLLFVCYFLFKETLAQKTFLFFTTWCFTTAVSSLCGLAAAWLAPESHRFLVRCMIYAGSYLILLPLYLIFWRRAVKEILVHLDRGNPIYALFPLIAFVLLAMLFGPMQKPDSWTWFLAMALFLAFVIFTYYLLITHFKVVLRQLKFEIHLEESRRHRILEGLYYEELDRSLRLQSQRLHDTRHHLLTLGTLANNKDLEGLGSYVAGLLTYYDHLEAKKYCEHPAANAVIGGYLQAAQQNGIEVRAEVSLPQTLNMDDYDLCSLLGNTLENSLEACQRIPKESPGFQGRFIHLKARMENPHLILRIENSFDPGTKPAVGSGGSSKGDLGGIGLESVRTVVEKYQGALTWETQGQVFILSVVLSPSAPAPAEP